MTNLPSNPTPSPHSPTEWWTSPWFRRHAIAAPFGIFAVTWLLCWRATGQWECWQHLELASSFVDLATIIYGMFAVTFEGGVKIVFWAIEQWKNQRARDRAEGRAEGYAEGRAAVFAELRAKGNGDVQDEGNGAESRSEISAEILQSVLNDVYANMAAHEFDAAVEKLRSERGVNGKK